VKRFWKAVSVAPDQWGGHGLRLDGRPVRTPGRLPLIVPNAALAEAIADEWRNVTDEIDPRAMPLTGLANAAVERVARDPAPFIADIAGYGETDLLCYRAEAPDSLVARQAAVWDPLLDWARERYDIAFVVTTGIMHRAQPAATVTRLREAVTARDPFRLAALAPLTTIGGSLIAALALDEGAADVDTVWVATHLDELWQAEMWGDDAQAASARAARRRDFEAAAGFLRLLDGGRAGD